MIRKLQLKFVAVCMAMVTTCIKLLSLPPTPLTAEATTPEGLT